MLADIARQALSFFRELFHLLYMFFTGTFIAIGISGTLYKLNADKGFTRFVSNHSRVPGFILIAFHDANTSK